MEAGKIEQLTLSPEFEVKLSEYRKALEELADAKGNCAAIAEDAAGVMAAQSLEIVALRSRVKGGNLLLAEVVRTFGTVYPHSDLLERIKVFLKGDG